MGEKKKEEAISRRKYLGTVGGLAAATVAGWAVTGYLASRPKAPLVEKTVTVTKTITTAPVVTTPTTPPGKKVTIDFVIWTWGVELVEDHVNKFMSKHPDINVKLSDIAQETYREGLITRFTAGTPTDLCYSSVEYQREFEEAGWIAPVEDYFPEIKKYLPDIAFRPAIMSKEGKILGLLYYADNTNFLFNKKHLDAIGEEIPQTKSISWDELREIALKIKKAGVVDYPMAAFFGSYGFWQTIYTFIVGMSKPIDKEGLHYLFDEDLNPVMDKDSPLFTALRWLVDVINVDKTFTPASINYGDPDMINNTGSGMHSLVWMPTYDFAPTNHPGQKEYGNIFQAINPGTGVASAWARPYNVTRYNLNREESARVACHKLHMFFGGKTDENYEPVSDPLKEGEYRVNKRIFIEKGVPTPYLSLLEDPEYVGAYKQFGQPEIALEQLKKTHVHQVDGETVPWWGEWSGGWGLGFARVQLNALLLGQKGTSDSDILNVLNTIASKWKELKGKV